MADTEGTRRMIAGTVSLGWDEHNRAYLASGHGRTHSLPGIDHCTWGDNNTPAVHIIDCDCEMDEGN